MRGRFLTLVVWLVACGVHHVDPHDDSLAVLTIDPPTSELEIINSTPVSEPFTATLTYPDATTKDVTADVHFSIDTSYGDFVANTLTMHSAGKTSVYGSYVDKVGNAIVIARLKSVRVDAGVPPNAPDWFSGPEDPTRAPAVVYPPANVSMPRN